MQNDYNLYGAECFIFEQIRVVSGSVSKIELLNIEQSEIDSGCPYYNIQKNVVSAYFSVFRGVKYIKLKKDERPRPIVIKKHKIKKVKKKKIKTRKKKFFLNESLINVIKRDAEVNEAWRKRLSGSLK